MVAYGEIRESHLCEFFKICLQFFGIVRPSQEIVYRDIEIIRNALKGFPCRFYFPKLIQFYSVPVKSAQFR